MNLNISKWKYFKISKLFEDFTGKDLIIGEIEQGSIPIASNSVDNNNIVAYTKIIPNRKLFDHKISISIADRGKFWAFIQPKDFYISTRAKALVCKNPQITINQLAFITTIINRESFKFCYGRNCCDNLPSIQIKLPIQHKIDGSVLIDDTHEYSNEGYIPDWQFMEDYIKGLHYKALTTKNKKNKVPDLNVQKWCEFSLKELFGDCERGVRITTDDRLEGNIPFCTAGEFNEGVSEFIGNPEAKTYNNALSIDMFGNCFYHGYDFKCDDNILVITNEHINKYVGIFISQIISIDNYRNNYGRQYRKKDYLKHKIKLPVDTKGNPDWQFMEDYIKALPYGDRI